VGTLDGIIDTVSAVHPLLPMIGLLKSHGKLIMLGVIVQPLQLPEYTLIQGKQMKNISIYIYIYSLRMVQEKMLIMHFYIIKYLNHV